MSRLIVKGLPQYATEERIRRHFATKGDVTDVKLMKKRNGESRKFAFVGYKSSQDAENAVKFFNNSYIDTARLEVELAKTFSDPTVPISMRDKRRLDAERFEKREQELKEREEQRDRKKQKVKTSKINEEIQNNPQLKEFVDSMRPASMKQSWANDTIADGSGAPSAKALEEALAKQDGTETVSPPAEIKLTVKQDGSDDEYDDLPGKVSSDEEMIPFTNNEEENRSETGNDDETNLAAQEGVSDLEWLQMRRKRMIENQEREQAVNHQQKDKTVPKSKPPPQQTQPEIPDVSVADKIRETGRLFIRNILYTSTEDDFRDLFQKYGKLEEVHIAIDTRTGKSKGFVYVQYNDPEDAVNAYNALDKEIFQGRLLHILPGEKKKSHRLDEFDLKNLPLKKQRELKRKDQASKIQFSWNSLYMNQDAVLESVASKMGIPKSKLIDAQSSDSAVKQALAEAHVIGDVRQYFESKGVDLTTFSKGERDDRIILVKNFTFGTTIGELADMFSPYGDIKRMLMPPSGTIAIIEYRDVPSARAAFTKLSYKRFKKSILYLEKGPKDLFTREPSEGDSVMAPDPDRAVEAKLTATDVMESENKEDDQNDNLPEGPTVSVFVKNLNFATTSQQLASVFSSLPGFAVATVKTKPDPKKSGGVLSMGFGFAEFKSKEEADKAIAVMDGYVLDGHKLQLKLSNRASSSTTKSKKGIKSTKIIIKNLPFEATRKDIVELFGAFGKLKSARVPKKFDKSARGFAFVEFNLLKEAENAMKQLEGVHLLGRRLVMDYAEHEAEDAEAEIERMTQKVKQQVATQQLAASRLAGKGKVNLDLEEEDEGF